MAYHNDNDDNDDNKLDHDEDDDDNIDNKMDPSSILSIHGHDDDDNKLDRDDTSDHGHDNDPTSIVSILIIVSVVSINIVLHCVHMDKAECHRLCKFDEKSVICDRGDDSAKFFICTSFRCKKLY